MHRLRKASGERSLRAMRSRLHEEQSVQAFDNPRIVHALSLAAAELDRTDCVTLIGEDAVALVSSDHVTVLIPHDQPLPPEGAFAQAASIVFGRPVPVIIFVATPEQMAGAYALAVESGNLELADAIANLALGEARDR